MTPIDTTEQPIPPGPLHFDGDADLDDPDDLLEFGTNKNWTAGGQVWVLTFDVFHKDPLYEGLNSPNRDLAIEILTDDPPQIEVRTAAVYRWPGPVTQDPCIATTQPAPGLLGNDGVFSLSMPTVAANLGQSLVWRDVRIVGQRELDETAVSSGRWVGEVAAEHLAEYLYGDPSRTDDLLADGFEIYGCSSTASCVELDYPVTLTPVSHFVLEPVTEADVLANSQCDEGTASQSGG